MGSLFLQHFTKAKLRKPLIQCQRVNQHNNFNSSSHPDNLSEGFRGMSEIATWETDERASDSREIGISWVFTTRLSDQELQSRRPTRRNCLFVLSLCLGWGRSEEHPGIPGCPSAVTWDHDLQGLFPFSWEELVLEHHTANLLSWAAPSVHTNSDSICTIVIWALHRYARK